MIADAEFLHATDAAFQEFKAFSDHVGPQNLHGLWSGEPNGRRKITRLLTFLFKRHDSTVFPFEEAFPKELPRKFYGSWLFRMADNKMRIAVDTKTLNEWAGTHGVPVETQITRSIVHELGHKLLSTNLLQAEAEDFTVAATAEQEEIAWVFAMTFLACVLGHYAYFSRVNHDKDDAPGVLL